MAYRSSQSSASRTSAARRSSARGGAPRTGARGGMSRTGAGHAAVSRSAVSSRRSQASSRGQGKATSVDAPFFGQAAPVLEPDLQRDFYQPDLRVVSTAPGSRASARGQQANSVGPTVVKMAAIVIVLVAVLSFVRIALTSNSVTTMIQSDALSTQISEARSTGTSLEMEQSVLKNPSAVKAQAKQLGMAAPEGTTIITLEPDVVAINNDNTLSLSDTIKNVAEVTQ